MSLLLLVRHGQASWGADDYDVLSEPGGEQSPPARRGAGRARRRARTLLVRGAMRRHRQTAEALPRRAGGPRSPEVTPAGTSSTTWGC